MGLGITEPRESGEEGHASVEARTENGRPVRCAVRKTLILSFSRREKGSALAAVVRSKVAKSVWEVVETTRRGLFINIPRRAMRLELGHEETP